MKIAPALCRHLETFLSPTQTIQVINAYQTKRPTTFRFNLLKVDQEQIPGLLRDITTSLLKLTTGSTVLHRSVWHPFAYKIDLPTTKLMALPQYLDGLILFQNQSSMIPPLALSPLKATSCLDMCAAPGGKTLGLLELIPLTTPLVALDINRTRFESLQKFMSIYAADDTRLTLYRRDATRLKTPLYDAILCDAPCTGSGVISLHDARTLKHFYDLDGWIKENTSVQSKLLDAAYQSLVPGGSLVYSTCSIFPEENENMVNAFLAKHDDMSCVDLPRPFGNSDDSAVFGSKVSAKICERPSSFECGINSFARCLRIMPSHDSEGFFVAKFRKSK